MNKIDEFRKKYPYYNDLSDNELADKLYNKFYFDMPKNEFYNKIGFNNLENKNYEKNKNESFFNKLKNYIPEMGVPIGVNVASGLMSLAGRNKQEKELMRNLPQIATGQQPNVQSSIGNAIGEYLPMEMTGIGQIPGLLGNVARIGATSGFGAAMNPEDRSKGAIEGAIVGAAGEALPIALNSISSLAEKVNPLNFAKSKMSEIIEKYQNAKNKQNRYYTNALKDIGNNKVIDDPLIKSGYHNPKDFLGFNKTNLSINSKKIYDDFLKEPTINNLHNLQSQLYKDSIKYKNNPNRSKTYEKSNNYRNELVVKLKELLSKNPKALENYNKGSDITKNVIKPYETTPNLRKILNGKIEKLEPKKLKNIIQLAKEKEKGNIPKNHHLNQVYNELNKKISQGDVIKEIVPEALRKWMPNYVKMAQNPSLQEALIKSNLIYQPVKKLTTSKILEN